MSPSTVLIANRGEIAVRVIRTLREMGLRSVAVYTEVDADAMHVSLADEAVSLGEPPNYLDIEGIIAACQATGATAIHPGYGFLSQNAGFVRACSEAGITFVGPGPEAMEQLGDKSASRALAQKVGVPVIPGAERCEDATAAKAAAAEVGYPVLLKAAGGGGGKGMRRVDDESQVEDAFDAARREAMSAFADDRMLVEKFIHPARHIEVQILADGKQAVALGERECSLQRRYQKVIEEAPASTISEETRRAVFASAVKLAEAAGYANAGTVEFLVGPDGAHYFLEVNTRLQVEHPVTEALIGLDIVRAQIEIAHGGGLPEVRAPRGHAIEARLNAEDPYHGFLPQIGDVLLLDWPQIPGVRIDSGLREGLSISPHYDSLVAKVIAHGESREMARNKLLEALRGLTVLGMTTNLSFLIDLLESDVFISGETYTTSVEAMTFETPELPDAVRALAQDALAGRSGQTLGDSDRDRFAPWDRLGAFRMGEQ
ncbi:MAG: biotin carboxylase N-terminal domain-containing protein [Myxococcota bacterium]